MTQALERSIAHTHHHDAVRLVANLVKSLGFNKPDAMTNLFLEIVQDTQVDPAEIAFQRVRMRSAKAEERLLGEEGGLLSDADFTKKLGVSSRSTIKNYREQLKIFAVPQGPRNFRYPAWQIHQRELLPGLQEVLQVLIGKYKMNPLGVVLLFLTKAEALEDQSPLELLRGAAADEDLINQVVEFADHYGDAR